MPSMGDKPYAKKFYVWQIVRKVVIVVGSLGALAAMSYRFWAPFLNQQ